MPQEYLRAVMERDQRVNLLFRHLDARVESAGEGRARVCLPVSERLSQGGGMVAGGILATMADEAMAHAVLSLLHRGQHTATAEMNIRFLRASDPKRGGEITAEARVVKAGRSLIFAEAQVGNGEGKLLATAGGTFWVGGEPALTHSAEPTLPHDAKPVRK